MFLMYRIANIFLGVLKQKKMRTDLYLMVKLVEEET